MAKRDIGTTIVGLIFWATSNVIFLFLGFMFYAILKFNREISFDNLPTSFFVTNIILQGILALMIILVIIVTCFVNKWYFKEIVLNERQFTDIDFFEFFDLFGIGRLTDEIVDLKEETKKLKEAIKEK